MNFSYKTFFNKAYFPIFIARSFKLIFGLFKPATKSYSQKGEDILVDCYFKRSSKGYYLDIGCFHPIWASNTHLFHKKGWNGSVVDIDDYKLNLFKRLRRGKVNTIHSAVVDLPKGKGIAEVYKFNQKIGWSLIDTLDKEVAELNKGKGWGEYSIEKINTIDINTLLDSLPHVNFLSIDAEGMDDKIVSKIDLSKHAIELILFEDNDIYGGRPSLINKLKDNGYFHLFTSGGSVCYALKSGLDQ